jgi:hypothetical protein
MNIVRTDGVRIVNVNVGCEVLAAVVMKVTKNKTNSMV